MELFPAMPLAQWRPTKETLHRFEQIVGKIRLVAGVRRNHWWNVPFHLTGRGLTTRPMGEPDRLFCIDLDLIGHRLVVTLLDGRTAAFSMIGRSVADFYRTLSQTLAGLGIAVTIDAKPFDLSDTTPFRDDDIHDVYDPAEVTRYWQILSQVNQVLERHAAGFSGKISPVHHFWHTFDLAVTAFTGRPAEVPADADSVTREAYSREVISFGFWFGDDKHPAPMFYSYAAPEPDGLADQPLQPEQAHWERSGAGHLAVLSYDDARAASDPIATILRFFDSVYQAGGRLLGLDTDALSCSGGITDPVLRRRIAMRGS